MTKELRARFSKLQTEKIQYEARLTELNRRKSEILEECGKKDISVEDLAETKESLIRRRSELIEKFNSLLPSEE